MAFQHVSLAENLHLHKRLTSSLQLVAVTLCAFPAMAFAQEPSALLECRGTGDDLPSVGVYSFFQDAGRLMCLAPRQDGDGTDVPRLRVGRSHVGKSRESLEPKLGPPWQELDARLPGLTTSAYLVFTDSIENNGAYYAIEYEQVNREDVAFSVQLTGNRPDTPHHFSCLHPGDHQALVERQLGEPTDVSPFEFEDDGVTGVVWSYAPLPVSIELVDGKVYSFRVWRPEHVEPKERRLSLLEKR